jgi:hypothetical protein
VFVGASFAEDVNCVRYRGIFINDEFYSLKPWAAKHYGHKEGIGVGAYTEIFKLMNKYGLNLIWPAMHPDGIPKSYDFSERPENLALADKYGITVGTSHCEPMLRNNSVLPGHLHKKWSWKRHRSWMLDYWREGVRRGTGHNVMWTIGMRGICDSGQTDWKTDSQKVKGLQDVFAAQCNMLPKDAPKVFIPYKEVLPVLKSGLKIPDGTTLMWVNDNYGYIRRLGGPKYAHHPGGIYYHVSYYGSPHSYIHLCTTPPALLWYELVAKCWNNGVRDTWMLNVGDVFQAETIIDCFGRFATKPDSWGADAQDVFLHSWAKENFGEKYAERIAKHMADYYNLGFIRKPEFMCLKWTWNLPSDFRRKLIKRYHSHLAETRAIDKSLPPEKRDLWFRLAGFSCEFLAHAGIIHLEGKDREYAKSVIDPLHARWDKMDEGKWSDFWYDTIDEGGLSEKSRFRSRGGHKNAWDSPMQWPWNEPEYLVHDSIFTQYRADIPEPEWCEPIRMADANGGGWRRVSGLGTSGKGLALLPVKPGVGDGATIEYDVSKGGTLVLQFLPDYPLWPGLKYGVDVSFDCGEPRYVPVPMLDHVPCVKVSNRKRAMMDQYVRSEIEIPSNAKVVKISANGPGVVIDCVGIRTKEREPKKATVQRKIIKMNY